MDPMVIDLMRYRGAMRVAKVAQQPALLSRRDTFVSAVCQGGWGGLPCPRLYVVHQTGLAPDIVQSFAGGN